MLDGDSDEKLKDETWLDVRTAIATKHENSKYDEEKAHLMEEIEKLRSTVRSFEKL